MRGYAHFRYDELLRKEIEERILRNVLSSVVGLSQWSIPIPHFGRGGRGPALKPNFNLLPCELGRCLFDDREGNG